MSWLNVFTGIAQRSAFPEYELIEPTEDVTLVWPTESMSGVPYVADWIDVDGVGCDVITMPDARQAATGISLVIANIGTAAFELDDSAGSQITMVDPGTAWVILLTDNSTAAGTWRVVQLGAMVSDAQAGALAGAGLEAVLTLLRSKIAITTISDASYTLLETHRANGIVVTGSNPHTLQLGAIGDGNGATVKPGWWCMITNESDSVLTVATSGADTINQGEPNFTLPAATTALRYAVIVVCAASGFHVFGSQPIPLPIAGGGTGATTAGDALTNLGGTAIGISVFTAPSAAAIITLLGIQQTLLTESTVSTDQTLVATDSGKAYLCESTLTLTLPEAGTVGDGYYIFVNAFGGDVTLDPPATDGINDQADGAVLVLARGESVLLVSDGSSPNGTWWTFFQNVYYPQGTGAVLRTMQNKLREFLSVEDFDAIGDDTVEDQAAFERALAAASALGGGIVRCAYGKTYKISEADEVNHLSAFTIPDNVRLDLNGSTLRLVLTGQVYGIRLLNQSQIYGGQIDVNSQGGVGMLDQGIWQCAVSVGPAYGDGGTVASPSPHDSAKGWRMADLVITSDRDAGYIIACTGGVSAGVIERIEFISNDVTRVVIGLDWGTLGTISSSQSAMATNKANYLANTARSTHPQDIDIRDITIGNMTRIAVPGQGDLAGSIAFRLSGCHHIRAKNWRIEGCTHAAAYLTAGDLGMEYATAGDRAQAYQGIVLSNFALFDGVACLYGVFGDTLGDNVWRAQYSNGYVPMVDPFWHGDIVIEDSCFNGANIDNIYGARLIQAKGFTLLRNTFSEWQSAVWADEMSEYCEIDSNIIRNNRRDGVVIGLAELREATRFITVQRNYIYDNGALGSYSGITVVRGYGHVIEGNFLGKPSEANQDFGIAVTDGFVESVHIRNNQVRGAVTAAYALMTGTPTGPHVYRALAEFVHNTSNPGIPTFSTGISFVPTEIHLVGTRQRTDWFTDQNSSPAAGSWYRGEKIWRADLTAATTPGEGVVTAGSFGTLSGLTNASTANNSDVVTMSLAARTCDTTAGGVPGSDEGYTLRNVSSVTNLRVGLPISVPAAGIVNAEILTIVGSVVTIDQQANATLTATALETAGVIVGEVLSFNTTPARSSCIVEKVDGLNVTLDTLMGSTEINRTVSFTAPVFKNMAALAA